MSVGWSPVAAEYGDHEDMTLLAAAYLEGRFVAISDRRNFYPRADRHEWTTTTSGHPYRLTAPRQSGAGPAGRTWAAFWQVRSSAQRLTGPRCGLCFVALSPPCASRSQVTKQNAWLLAGSKGCLGSFSFVLTGRWWDGTPPRIVPLR